MARVGIRALFGRSTCGSIPLSRTKQEEYVCCVAEIRALWRNTCAMSQKFVWNYTIVQNKYCSNKCAVSQEYVRFVGIRVLCRKHANEWMGILAYRESARA